MPRSKTGTDACSMSLGLIFRDKKLSVSSLDPTVPFKVRTNKGQRCEDINSLPFYLRRSLIKLPRIGDTS